MSLKRKTLKGPCGATLELDPAQVFPDDPGAGTPALVRYRGHTGTYWCCINECECDGVELPQDVVDWLNSDAVSDEVESLGA